ncbi:MAG: TetR/AcrR family transcriptional regulator [Streptomycetaceae bacterium]|nr:TetR/AcrR family transcriptional regulator [Streptomycetaceae bacterium]
MPEPAEASPRRRELLAATLAYAAEHNLSDLSLRPLAAAIGSSPRVLLYLFGSKDGLMREVLAAGREEQLALVERAYAEAADPRAALELLWEWCTAPHRRSTLRLFFEGYVRSPGDDGPWHGFATASLDDWLPPFERLFADTDIPATLALAVLRGLLLDVIAQPAGAGASQPRIDAAWHRFLDGAFDSAPPSGGHRTAPANQAVD